MKTLFHPGILSFMMSLSEGQKGIQQDEYCAVEKEFPKMKDRMQITPDEEKHLKSLHPKEKKKFLSELRKKYGVIK